MSENIGRDWKFGEHGGVPLHERQQAVLGHCGDEFVEHAALPKHGVSTPFGGVWLEVPIIAQRFASSAERRRQGEGERVQQPQAQHPAQLDVVRVKEGHDAVVQQVGGGDREFAVVELGKTHLAVDVNEDLLVDAPDT